MSFSKYILIVFLTTLGQNMWAQFYNMPNHFSSSFYTEKKLAKKDSSLHTGLKPYNHLSNDKYIYVSDTSIVFKYIKEDPALDLIFYNHLLDIKPAREKVRLTVDPILSYTRGRDLADTTGKKLSTNTRGIIATASIGKDFYCESMFLENQSFFPDYLSAFAKSTLVVPGQGRHKTFKKTGFDYAMSSGFISYQPFKRLSIQTGHGKHKIGNGYRSLLLSDNVFNYPYLKVSHEWLKGRLSYTNIYAALMNLDSASIKPTPNAERLYQKKPAAFQYLSLNATKWLNISLFQGIIWEAGNEKNKQQLNWMYFNPLIFSQALDYGLSSRNNIIVGTDFRVKATNKLSFYGQFMLDELSTNKDAYGYQFGVSYYDVFGIPNLTWGAEYNYVTEGSYNSIPGSRTNQSYSHYNQNLAYSPDFGSEFITYIDYKFARFYTNIRQHYGVKNLENSNGYSTSFTRVTFNYLINPSYNLALFLGYDYRYQKFHTFNKANQTTSFLHLGFVTNLINIYTDY